MLSRRAVLSGASAIALAAVAPGAWADTDAGNVYIGARVGGANDAFATGFRSDGTPVCDLALPSRGHGFALRRSTGEVAAFARRPGTFLIVFDPVSGRQIHRIDAATDRRFCGHGIFARAGTVLIATELEYSTGDGVLGLYDTASGYRRVGEYRSGGLDPHELVLLPDGATLVVANGGILTDPDAPGIKLNRDALDSSLAYIDARDGTLIERLRLPSDYAQLSLRHLSLSHDGSVAVAMQYEGPSGDAVPLVVTHRPGDKALQFLAAADRDLARLRNYCGSVAFDVTDRVLAVTSPVGGTVAFWDMGKRRYLGADDKGDVCGLAAGGRAAMFVVTSGLGGAAWVGTADREPRGLRNADLTFRWDNHLLRIASRPFYWPSQS